MERDVDVIQFVRLQIDAQGGSHPRPQGTEDRFPVRWSHFRKDDAERGSFLIPAGDVRLSDRGEDGGCRSLQDVGPIVFLVPLPGIEQHQDETLSRAFGPPPL